MKHLTSYHIFESIVSKSKDKEIFNYRSIVEDEWRKLIIKAQKFQHINFDLENDESTGQKKTIYIKKNLRKDQPVKYEFNCELCVAASDWENLVMYFRTEFTHEYFYGFDKFKDKPEYVTDVVDKETDSLKRSKLSKCHVFIPPKEAGNPLHKTEKGYTAYTNESLKEEGLKDRDIKLSEENYKKAWKWLEKMFEEMVENRHEMLDESTTSKLSDISESAKTK